VTISFKVQGYDLTTTNLTTTLTINTSSVAIVREVSIANDNSASVQLDYFFRDSSTSTDFKFYHTNLAANSNDTAVRNVLVLEEGDSLKFQANTANKISGQISYALINRKNQNG